MGDWEKALSDYSDSLELRPDNFDGYINRGLIYLDTSQFDQAASDFTRAHELDPDHAWALANRGIAHAWNDDRAAAEADFERVRALDPMHSGLPRIKAILALRDNDLPSAIDHLTASLAADPDDAWSLKMRADAYWKMGLQDRARDDDDRLEQLREDQERSESLVRS